MRSDSLADDYEPPTDHWVPPTALEAPLDLAVSDDRRSDQECDADASWVAARALTPAEVGGQDLWVTGLARLATADGDLRFVEVSVHDFENHIAKADPALVSLDRDARLALVDLVNTSSRWRIRFHSMVADGRLPARHS